MFFLYTKKKTCFEFLKALDVTGRSWLEFLCNIAWTSATVHMDDQTGVVVPLFKKEGLFQLQGDDTHQSPWYAIFRGAGEKWPLWSWISDSGGALWSMSWPFNSGPALWNIVNFMCCFSAAKAVAVLFVTLIFFHDTHPVIALSSQIVLLDLYLAGGLLISLGRRWRTLQNDDCFIGGQQEINTKLYHSFGLLRWGQHTQSKHLTGWGLVLLIFYCGSETRWW